MLWSQSPLHIWSDEDIVFDFPEEIEDRFTTGQCPALAYEIHLLTGWTIAMISDKPAGSPDYMAHVFIIDSDGKAIDVKGRRNIEEVKNDWYFCVHLHRFWGLKEFEYEMLDWDLKVRFNKDPVAKEYAKIIVGMLS